MPSEANQNKAITSVTVVAAYDNNANTAYFDNISLRLEPSQTYRYDSNGNPVPVRRAPLTPIAWT